MQVPAIVITPELYAWVIVPTFIFIALVANVSLGTLRYIFIARGMTRIASGVGFFEVLIFLFAIAEVLQNLYNPLSYIAYGAGFASGTYLGMWLERRMSLGMVLVRVITRRDASELTGYLRSGNYGITIADAQGSQGQVKILFSIIQRQHLDRFISAVLEVNPGAFYTIEDVRDVRAGVFPAPAATPLQAARGMFARRGGMR
ncbi:MAG: DUF2179 domain-containing protein [Methanomicrobiales archaeon]